MKAKYQKTADVFGAQAAVYEQQRDELVAALTAIVDHNLQYLDGVVVGGGITFRQIQDARAALAKVSK